MDPKQDVDMMSLFFLTTKHMFSVFGPLGLTGYVRAFPFHKHQTAGPIQSIKKQRAGNFTDKTWKTSLYGFVQNGGYLFLTCISNGEMMVFTHVFISGFPRLQFSDQARIPWDALISSTRFIETFP